MTTTAATSSNNTLEQQLAVVVPRVRTADSKTHHESDANADYRLDKAERIALDAECRERRSQQQQARRYAVSSLATRLVRLHAIADGPGATPASTAAPHSPLAHLLHIIKR